MGMPEWRAQVRSCVRAAIRIHGVSTERTRVRFYGNLFVTQDDILSVLLKGRYNMYIVAKYNEFQRFSVHILISKARVLHEEI